MSTPPVSHSSIATCVVCLCLAFFFAAVGMAKLVALEASEQTFDRWGFPEWFPLLIGALEVAGAVLLLSRRTATLGAAILAGVMLGAVATHLRPAGEPVHAILPAFLLVPIACVGFCRRLDATWMRRLSRRTPSAPRAPHRRRASLPTPSLRITDDHAHADMPDSADPWRQRSA